MDFKIIAQKLTTWDLGIDQCNGQI